MYRSFALTVLFVIGQMNLKLYARVCNSGRRRKFQQCLCVLKFVFMYGGGAVLYSIANLQVLTRLVSNLQGNLQVLPLDGFLILRFLWREGSSSSCAELFASFVLSALLNLRPDLLHGKRLSSRVMFSYVIRCLRI